MAPHYQSPEDTPSGILALDFDCIKDIADLEQRKGSFQVSEDASFAKAPIHVDHLPGALYVINTREQDSTPRHTTADPETLIVLDGLLLVAPNDGTSHDEGVQSYDMLREGEATEYHDTAITMQAVKVTNLFDSSPARCLALALFRDDDLVLRLPTDK